MIKVKRKAIWTVVREKRDSREVRKAMLLNRIRRLAGGAIRLKHMSSTVKSLRPLL